MIGEVEVENLKAIMDVSRTTRTLPAKEHLLMYSPAFFQLWLDNQSSMSAISSLYSRLAAALSGLRNAFFLAASAVVISTHALIFSVNPFICQA